MPEAARNTKRCVAMTILHINHSARSKRSPAISTGPWRHETRRNVSPRSPFSSIAVLGRSYNVSLPTATQVSRPETRCYLGYRYPCTRRGRQGASRAFLLLALDDRARRHTNSHGQTHGRGRGGSWRARRSCRMCDLCVPAPAAPESLTQFVNPSAPKSYTPSHRRIRLERAVVTPLNPSLQSPCCLVPARVWRSCRKRDRQIRLSSEKSRSCWRSEATTCFATLYQSSHARIGDSSIVS